MILTIYEGITLVSSSYCERKLEELEEKNTLAHIQVSDAAMQAYSKTDEYYNLTRSIQRYRDILCRLSSDFATLKVEDIVEYVTKQMALKIEENAINEFTIKFSCASENTVEIKIEDVFTTELTFKEKVYDERCYPNEDYDGYSDTARYIYVNEKTKFFNTIIESIKNELQKKIPKTCLTVIS